MKTSVVIGSTGLIGRNLIEILSKNEGYSNLYSISRRKPDPLPSNVTHIEFNSGDYSIPQNIDTAFCCLGTTMKKAGSKESFHEVDYEMVINFAKKAKEAGINRFAVVSSIGANPKASNFYLRTKGEVEEKLKDIGFERLVMVRPSLLLGKRNEKRIGEDIGKVLYSIFRFMFVGPLKKYRGINADDVATAMIALVDKGQGTVTAESNALTMFSKDYQE